MVGFVHQVLFEFLEKNLGPKVVADVKRRAGIGEDREFRYDTAYPEDEWQRIFQATLAVTGLSADDAESAFGDYCAVVFPERFSGFLRGVTSARAHLRRQPRIHAYIAASVPAAERKAMLEKFHLEELAGEYVMHYASPNRHCTLYKRIAGRVLERYGERGEISEPRCQKRGDPECEIHVRFLDGAQDVSEGR